MNPFNLLKEDHKKAKDLFKEWEDCGDRAVQKRKAISEKVFEELEIHTTIEEEIFYPALRDSGEEELEKLLNEAFEEHSVVKELIAEMQALDSEDETFQAKFTVMSENVKHHIEEEENELFPLAKKALKENSEEVGEEMKERKKELQAGFKTHNNEEHSNSRRV